MEAQEGIESMKASREKSAANGSAKATAMASYTKGIGAGWMAQRVAHGATRNESDRGR